jgi:hypothetical protein
VRLALHGAVVLLLECLCVRCLGRDALRLIGHGQWLEASGRSLSSGRAWGASRLLILGAYAPCVEGGVNIHIAPGASFKLLSKLEKPFSVMIGIAWKGKIGNSLVSEPEKVENQSSTFGILSMDIDIDRFSNLSLST